MWSLPATACCVAAVRDSPGPTARIPEPLHSLLTDAVRNLTQGRSLVLIPEEKQLTTQQAGELLGVSRPFLIRLLDAGEMPFSLVGRHRRIKVSDLIDYSSESLSGKLCSTRWRAMLGYAEHKSKNPMMFDERFVAALAKEIAARINPRFPRRNGANVNRLLSVKEAVAYIGRTEQALQHLIHKREIVVVRKGRRVHLDRAGLDRWIEANKE